LFAGDHHASFRRHRRCVPQPDGRERLCRSAGGGQAGTPAASSVNDAAAKHAKRTACLKDAKTKKLVGAEKTAFLKNCIDSP
jgi:psiF repeat